jgi:signal transduction histidine kinase
VGQLVQSFNLMAAQIEERTKAVKLESMGRLSAGIAHEINTPMQFIGDNTYFLRQAFAELLRVLQSCRELLAQHHNGSVPIELVGRVEAAIAEADLDFLAARIPQALQRSQEGVERVSQLVGAMKEFSHPGAKEQVPVDLNRTIESAVILSRNEWKYLADMTLDLDPSLPQVRCLAGEISQVLVNLIVNAAHAIGDVVGDGSAGKGTIAISTRLQADRVEVRVRDTGPGIPEAVQQHIFEPFFTTKDVGKGTGQGLAIAHDLIVGKHGGELFFETRPATGTTFVIRLPVDGFEDSPPRREREA